MSTLTKDLADMRREANENARSLEKSLYFNTQATLMLSIAIEEASAALKTKVKTAEEQLSRHESQREAQNKTRTDNGGRT